MDFAQADFRDLLSHRPPHLGIYGRLFILDEPSGTLLDPVTLHLPCRAHLDVPWSDTASATVRLHGVDSEGQSKGPL